MRLIEWITRGMLLLLPGETRRKHADELHEYFEMRLREVRSARGWPSALVAWIRYLVDVAGAALADRRDERLRSAAQNSESSNWVQRAGAVVGQDVSYALRALRRSPGFALMAILSMGLGIGTATAVFSLVDGVVLRALPFHESDRLVKVYETTAIGDRYGFSGANYLDLKTRTETLGDLAGHTGLSLSLVGGEYPSLVRGESVTDNFFSALSVAAYYGRTLTANDETQTTARSAVISYGFWQSQFAASRDALGQALNLNGEFFTVVGVMPPEFDFPEGTQVWLSSRSRVPDPPFDLGQAPAENRGIRYFDVFGRLRDGVASTEAALELDLIGSRLAQEHADFNRGGGLVGVPLRETLVGAVRAPLFLLLGAVGLMLLIACTNVAGLLLARSIGRETEVATRIALGASRTRIVRQLVTEGLVLSLIGGVVGLVASAWLTTLFVGLAPADTPRISEVGVNLRAVWFAGLCSCGTGLLFGLTPAVKLLRSSCSPTIKAGKTRAATAGRAGARSMMMVGEIAVSFVLLFASLLTVVTLYRIASVDPGFETGGIVAADIALPETEYSRDSDIVGFFSEVVLRVKKVPGIQSAGVVLNLPLSGRDSHYGFSIEGRSGESSDEVRVAYQLADIDYFRTLGIQIVRGRSFSSSDGTGAPSVAVVNERLAARLWPNEDPIGRRITWGDPEGENADWVTIVGIVGDTRQQGLDHNPVPEVYRPYWQAPSPRMSLAVHGALSEAATFDALRNTVVQVDAERALFNVRTMERLVSSSMTDRRFNMRLLGLFALFAVGISAIGLYGLVSFSVAECTREIGIRIAVGARSSQVVAQVVRHGARLVAIGLAVGIFGAVSLGRVMSSLAFGVSPNSPAILAVCALVIVCISAMAFCVPAYRAARIEPVKALRCE